MIWKITKKEFLLNLMTFKFAVRAVACIALTTNLKTFTFGVRPERFVYPYCGFPQLALSDWNCRSV